MYVGAKELSEHIHELYKYIERIEKELLEWKSKYKQAEKEIQSAERQIHESFNVSDPDQDNNGFPTRLSFLIHEIWKRDPKTKDLETEVVKLRKLVSGNNKLT